VRVIGKTSILFIMSVLAMASYSQAGAAGHTSPLRLWGSLETSYRDFDYDDGNEQEYTLNGLFFGYSHTFNFH